MSVWVRIEFAPKARPVDLWGEDCSPETSRALMMVPTPRRWADCVWSPRVEMPSGLLMGLPEGWYYRVVLRRGGRDGLAGDWLRIWATHYMEIPEGPKP